MFLWVWPGCAQCSTASWICAPLLVWDPVRLCLSSTACLTRNVRRLWNLTHRVSSAHPLRQPFLQRSECKSRFLSPLFTVTLSINNMGTCFQIELQRWQNEKSVQNNQYYLLLFFSSIKGLSHGFLSLTFRRGRHHFCASYQAANPCNSASLRYTLHCLRHHKHKTLNLSCETSLNII